MDFQYRPDVVAQLVLHGVRPTSSTRPAFVQRYLNALYRYELRRLRTRLQSGAVPKSAYTSLVIDLRLRYPLVSLSVSDWTIPGTPADAAPLC